MTDGLIVSVSGVRGVVGTDLTPEVVVRFAAAFGHVITGGKGGDIVLGRDARVTGPMLADTSLLVALYTVAAECEWVLVVAASVILEVGIVMATLRWTPTGNHDKSIIFLNGRAFTALVEAGRAVVTAIREAPKPVIASVNGPAAGGGANLAFADGHVEQHRWKYPSRKWSGAWETPVQNPSDRADLTWLLSKMQSRNGSP